MSLLDTLLSPWSIRDDALVEINAILSRHERGEVADLQALQARIGRPLQNTQTMVLRDGVAVLPVVGPIMRYANLLTDISGATSLQVLATDFQAAVDNPQVRRIVLQIDSPGGQANGIGEFAQLVRSSPKPVTAYVGNSAASAAYWIASAAREVVVAKSAMLGSVGVVLSINKRSQDGTVDIVSSQSPHKRLDVNTADGKEQLQALVDGLAQIFVQDVAALRGVSVDKVLSDFGRGGVVLAADAIAAGMADRIGTFEGMMAQFTRTTIGATAMTAETETPDQALTLDALRKNYPDIFTAAVAIGAEQERARIRAVEAQLIPGHESLVESAKYDGISTGEQVAARVVAAEREMRAMALQSIRDGAPDPVPHASAPASGGEEGGDLDSREKLHAAAKRHQKQHPGMDYPTAIKAVMKD